MCLGGSPGAGGRGLGWWPRSAGRSAEVVCDHCCSCLEEEEEEEEEEKEGVVGVCWGVCVHVCICACVLYVYIYACW